MVGLDLGLNLDLEVLYLLYDDLRFFLRDALLHLDDLFDRAARGGFGIGELEELEGNASFDELVLQDVSDVLRAELVFRDDSQGFRFSRYFAD